jgi:hypothetical protein
MMTVTRKRWLAVAMVLVAVVLVLGLAVRLLQSRRPEVTRPQYERIAVGMGLEEVEAILGRPTGDDPEGPIIMFEGVPESFVDPDSFPPDQRRQWVGNEHAILIELDERGRVAGKYFGHVDRPEGFFAQLLRRLGL